MYESYKRLLKAGPIIWGLGFTLGKIGWLIEWTKTIQIIGVTCFAIGVLFLIVKYINDKYQVTRSIDFRTLNRSEINRVIKISNKELNQCPSRNEIKQVLKIRNDIVTVQIHNYDILNWKHSKVTGFLTIFPLHDETARLLEREEITVNQFTGEHIASKGTDYNSIYLGGIASLSSGIPIISYLRGLINKERKDGLQSIYTNPTTDVGLRLAQSAGFQPVDFKVEVGTKNRIYQLDL